MKRECLLTFSILLTFIHLFPSPAADGLENLSVACNHIFREFQIPINLFLQNNLTITITDSFSSSILVKSTDSCCPDISIGTDSNNCSICTTNGIKFCYFNAIVSVGVIPEICHNESTLTLSCRAQKCPQRTDSNNVTISDPGDSTGCLSEGFNYQCTKYGNWTKSPCLPTAKPTRQAAVETSTTEDSIHINSTEANLTDSSFTESASQNWNLSTTDATEPDNRTDTVINQTEENVNNTTSHVAPPITATTPDGNVTLNGNNTYYTTTERYEDSEKAMKDLYTFLIVLGVVLFLVFILVCGFFLRKQKDKVSITHVDYPLEYWHNQEYIDNIAEKSYTQKSAFTVNPVFDRIESLTLKGNENPAFNQSRYKKKDESDWKIRRNATGDCSSTGGRTSSVGGEKPKRGRAVRKRSNGSASDRSSCDRPRRKTHDYVDKYVATAVGSNFYDYSASQSQDVVHKTTDLDLSTEDEGVRGSVPNIQSGTSSIRPLKHGRRQNRSRSNSHDGIEYEQEGNMQDMDLGDFDLYASVYKERLRKGLEDLSAEESDV